jgi:protein disulfide-isomerase A1
MLAGKINANLLLPLLAAVSLCFPAAFASIADYEEDDEVIVLTEDNFDKAVAEFKYLLVDFYAPWCGHCKTLAPEYVKASQALQESDSEIRLAKVDATTEKALAERFGVKSYPTIKFFKQGASAPIEYKSGHTAEEILIWLRKKSGKSVEQLDSVEEVKALVEKEEVVVIGFFKDIKSSKAGRAFIETADAIDDIIFATTDSKNAFAEYGITKDTIVLFKKFDERRNDLVADDNEDEVAAIKNLVELNRMPLVTEFSPESAPKIFARTQRTHFLLFISKESSKYERKIKQFTHVADEFKGKALFILVDVDLDEHKRVLDYFGLKRSDCPTFRLINLDGNVKYKPDKDELTVIEMIKFLDDVMAGRRKPHYMSEEIPNDWDSKPVWELVGKNFDEVAKDKTKDVLVKFYAPWCKHCKELAPVWEELGEKYKDRKDVVIAKIDATANEVEGVKVTFFPTIKLYPKDSDEVFELNRPNKTLELLTQFIEQRGQLPPEEPMPATPEETTKDEEAKKDEL